MWGFENYMQKNIFLIKENAVISTAFNFYLMTISLQEFISVITNNRYPRNTTIVIMLITKPIIPNALPRPKVFDRVMPMPQKIIATKQTAKDININVLKPSNTSNNTNETALIIESIKPINENTLNDLFSSCIDKNV